MDYYLKSTDEAALWAAIESAGLAYKQYDLQDPLNTPTGEIDWVQAGAFDWVAKTQLNIIGVMHVPTGETSEFEGRTFEVVEAIEGFHANLRGNLTEEQQSLLPLIDAPSTPSRVWA